MHSTGTQDAGGEKGGRAGGEKGRAGWEKGRAGGENWRAGEKGRAGGRVPWEQGVGAGREVHSAEKGEEDDGEGRSHNPAPPSVATYTYLLHPYPTAAPSLGYFPISTHISPNSF